MARTIPLALQTTYQDLLQAHLDRADLDFEGTPFQRSVNGRQFWYVTVRRGDRVVQKYIGPDSDELRDRIERLSDLRSRAAEIERRCTTLSAQLRAAKLPSLDRDTGKLLNALAKSGVFRLGGTLVGTHAFRLYDIELGASITSVASAFTEDVDIAAFHRLSLAVGDSADPSLTEALTELGLEPVPGLDAHNRTARWRMPGGGPVIDFLTPSFSEEEGLRRLESLGVWAQSLHFLNFLIAEPIHAVAIYRGGILLRIPRPERFAVHKLIVSQRRSGATRAKGRKDLLQAKGLLSVLIEDRPIEVEEAFGTALGTGPAWRQALHAAVRSDTELAGMTARFLS